MKISGDKQSDHHLNKKADRKKRIEIYRDTMKLCQEDKTLSDALSKTKANICVFYPNDYEGKTRELDTPVRVEVSERRSFEAACLAHKANPDQKICVLNFANAFHAGGGVADGSSAQEESLCRCSTLFPALEDSLCFHKYYKFNRYKADSRALDNLIYTPDIVVFKNDTDFPEIMDKSEWFKTDVITCAAPDLRGDDKVTAAELFGLHVKRAIHILNIAVFFDVDCLILGAFGCGAFKNDPATVARAWKAALEEYPSAFRHIEFAVFCKEDKTNYEVFKRVFGS